MTKKLTRSITEVDELKSKLKERDDEIALLRNESAEKSFLEKKLWTLQSMREKERKRFLDEIDELRGRLTHEQDGKKFYYNIKAVENTKQIDKGGTNDLTDTVTKLTKENQRLLRELECQDENSDLLIRENARLSKVVQSLQVECSLCKMTVDELSRKCKIKEKFITSLKIGEDVGNASLPPISLNTRPHYNENYEKSTQQVQQRQLQPNDVKLAADVSTVLSAKDNDRIRAEFQTLLVEANGVWEAVNNVNLADIKKKVEELYETLNVSGSSSSVLSQASSVYSSLSSLLNDYILRFSNVSAGMYHILETINDELDKQAGVKPYLASEDAIDFESATHPYPKSSYTSSSSSTSNTSSYNNIYSVPTKRKGKKG